MAAELGEEADPEAVRYSLVYRFGRAMGLRMVEGGEAVARERD
jgi:hypothetical protein